MTATKAKPKIECGAKARWQSPAKNGIRLPREGNGRLATTWLKTSALIRSSQLMTDRRINPKYINNKQVFAETLDGGQ